MSICVGDVVRALVLCSVLIIRMCSCCLRLKAKDVYTGRNLYVNNLSLIKYVLHLNDILAMS